MHWQLGEHCLRVWYTITSGKIQHNLRLCKILINATTCGAHKVQTPIEQMTDVSKVWGFNYLPSSMWRNPFGRIISKKLFNSFFIPHMLVMVYLIS
jgi:hypothetical protein